MTTESIVLPRLEEPCAACDSTGVVWAPEWREWSKGWDMARAAAADLALGAGATLEYEQTHPLPEGPEEEPCHECEGNGAIPTEAGQELLRFLYKWHTNWRHHDNRA